MRICAVLGVASLAWGATGCIAASDADPFETANAGVSFGPSSFQGAVPIAVGGASQTGTFDTSRLPVFSFQGQSGQNIEIQSWRHDWSRGHYGVHHLILYWAPRDGSTDRSDYRNWTLLRDHDTEHGEAPDSWCAFCWPSTRQTRFLLPYDGDYLIALVPADGPAGSGMQYEIHVSAIDPPSDVRPMEVQVRIRGEVHPAGVYTLDDTRFFAIMPGTPVLVAGIGATTGPDGIARLRLVPDQYTVQIAVPTEDGGYAVLRTGLYVPPGQTVHVEYSIGDDAQITAQVGTMPAPQPRYQ
jgi:hypothetical protein